MNRDQSIIASICYFSVFFMPFIVPIVAYFVVDQKETKRHAVRALWSHLLPIAACCILIFGSIPFLLATQSTDSVIPVMTVFILTFIIAISFLISVIWNIIQGIKVLQTIKS
ncbi:hypothetical protein BK049_11105 [Bacillus xiamenensis]|uniref:DUF4870 domain-containing protein n=1 Tax=Bacillus xiamenensis TaxID=1178537 RepID=A0AAC9NCX0_9BACI|nr:MULTISPECIES: hypothetical protein [Bacillus]AOZ89184.1 hypothetical protein BK049_11105 [Bacillus xiamenensis]EKF35446.1 hypothetical protein BA1_10211 [Bacillus xiamenensis]MBG9912072.1 membrane protein [Bacillus xiamenensis]MCY9577116.1 hypothetical protein [Bacillus xiamenensis]QGX64618.1 hypothetical protein GPA07_03815 [Bacillus sp. ms-22]